jgi:hypothetical protein
MRSVLLLDLCECRTDEDQDDELIAFYQWCVLLSRLDIVWRLTCEK